MRATLSGMKLELIRLRPRPCTMTTAFVAGFGGVPATAGDPSVPGVIVVNHQPFKGMPSVAANDTSSCVGATAVAGGSSATRSSFVSPSATRTETYPYATSPSTNAATAKYGQKRRIFPIGGERSADSP